MFQSLLRKFSASARAPIRTISEALKQRDVLIVDVRTVEEVAVQGGCNGSINVPLDLLPRNTNIFGADMSRPIVMYCAKGFRSRDAAAYMNSLGYTNVFNGINAENVDAIIKNSNDSD
jgi:rhodanese-related sulfurtransferase